MSLVHTATAGAAQATATPVDSSLRGAILILGRTREGQRFRPDNWAERLCGVMSVFVASGPGSAPKRHGYSPYCMPTRADGVSAVLLDCELLAVERRAFEFILGFARDNQLQTVAASALDSSHGIDAPAALAA